MAEPDVYTLNRSLNDKLLALNYSKAFTTKYKCPAINSLYFCKQHNTAQQFFSFTCLASYLINSLSSTEIAIDSFDDPNLTIDKLLNASQSLIDVSALISVRAKLKTGFGPEVLSFLCKLVDKVFEKQVVEKHGDTQNGHDIDESSMTNGVYEGEVKVRYLSTDGQQLTEEEIDADDDEDENVIEDDDGENEIELEEEFADYVILDNGDDFGDDSLFGDEFVEPLNSMLEAQTDLTAWKLELERVLPQLNARILGAQMFRGGAGSSYDTEWRLHFKAATNQNTIIDKNLTKTQSLISNLVNDIRVSLEKIDAKELYLKENASTIISEWQNVREKSDRLQLNYDGIQAETKDKHERLQQLTDEDRSVKTAIEEYSLKVTDSSPLIDAKKGLRDLRQDLTAVNIQIGVAVQTLVRHLFLAGEFF